MTAWVCEPDEPNEGSILTPAPAAVCWNAGINLAYASWGVEYATRARWVSGVPTVGLAGAAAGAHADPRRAAPATNATVISFKSI